MTPKTPAALERIRQHLLDVLPELDAELVQQVLEQAMIRGSTARLLDQYFQDRPDALARPGPRVPAGLVRLAHVLIDRGYAGVTAPACAECGKRSRLMDRTAGERSVCRGCAGRLRANYETCARCQRHMRIVSRREGPLCGTCYHKGTRTECAVCRRVRQPVVRRPDGGALCNSCAPRPVHQCLTCGDQAPAHALTPDGPVCRRCYRAPSRLCGQCGHEEPIIRRGRGGKPDLCAGCYRAPQRICSGCGRVRPSATFTGGISLCPSCHPRPPRTCAVCGQSRPVQADWPMGPVCNACYDRVRRTPRSCTRCGISRPLIGTLEGAALCGPCAGNTALSYACRGCGTSGANYRRGYCTRCVLNRRLTELLTGNDGRLAPGLDEIRTALCGAAQPIRVLTWLAFDGVPELLADLAAGEVVISHLALDQLPDRPNTTYIRDLLSTAGVLPVRNEELERLPRWADRALAQAPSEHRQIVSPFAHWFLIHRLRQQTRGRRGPSHAGIRVAQARIQQALELLAWLDAKGIALADLHQSDLDRWLTQGPRGRHAIRAFLRWAHHHRLARRLEIPTQRVGQPPTSSSTTNGSTTSDAALRTKTCRSMSASSAAWCCSSASRPPASST